MSEIDVTTYKSVIDTVLARLKVKSHQKEDFVQECYLALMEKLDRLEEGAKTGEDKSWAATICRDRVVQLFRKDNKTIKTESLDDPRTKASRFKEIYSGIVTEVELQEAILKLPYDDYVVVYSIYVEGKSERKTAQDLNRTDWDIRATKQRAIKQLKTYFEEKI